MTVGICMEIFHHGHLSSKCPVWNKDLWFQPDFPVSSGQKGLKIELKASGLKAMVIFSDIAKIPISHLMF